MKVYTLIGRIFFLSNLINVSHLEAQNDNPLAALMNTIGAIVDSKDKRQDNLNKLKNLLKKNKVKKVINSKNNTQRATPLFAAAKGTHIISPLRYSSESNDIIDITRRYLDDIATMIELLLEAGADPNIIGFSRYTSLRDATPLIAVAATSLSLSPSRLDGMFTISDATIDKIKTTISDATIKIAKMLLDANAKIDARSYYKDTPLMWAARKGNKNLVQLFLKKGADPTLKNNSGYNAISFADDHEKIVEILRKAQIIKEVQNGNIKEVKSLINEGVNVNTTDKYGTNLLMFAILEDHKNILNLLLQQKAIKINQKSKDGTTPLILATKRNKRDMVKLLLKNNADKTLNDNYGKTALDYAQEKNLSSIAKMLKK